MTHDQHISPETYLYLRREVDRLARELARVTVDRDHWYAAANYTPEELAEMRRRASLGIDENGVFQWPELTTE